MATAHEQCRKYCDLIAPDGPWQAPAQADLTAPASLAFESAFAALSTDAVLSAVPRMPEAVRDLIVETTPTHVLFNFAVGQNEVILDRAARSDITFDDNVRVEPATSHVDAAATAFRSTLRSRANRLTAIDTQLPLSLARACVGVGSQASQVLNTAGRAGLTGTSSVDFDNELDVYSAFAQSALQPFDCVEALNAAAVEFTERCNDADTPHAKLAGCPVDVVLRRVKPIVLPSSTGEVSDVSTRVSGMGENRLLLSVNPTAAAPDGSFEVAGVDCAHVYALSTFIAEAYGIFWKRATLLTMWLQDQPSRADDVDALRELLNKWDPFEVAEARAVSLKEAGNGKFKAEQYAEAIQLYSQAVSSAPAVSTIRAVLLTNRAIARLKAGGARECEYAIEDCTAAVLYDALHWKAYFRRAQAAAELAELALVPGAAPLTRGVSCASVLANALVDLLCVVRAAPRAASDEAAMAAVRLLDKYPVTHAMWDGECALGVSACLTLSVEGTCDIELNHSPAQDFDAGFPAELAALWWDESASASRAGGDLHLTPTAYALLHAIVERIGHSSSAPTRVPFRGVDRATTAIAASSGVLADGSDAVTARGSGGAASQSAASFGSGPSTGKKNKKSADRSQGSGPRVGDKDVDAAAAAEREAALLLAEEDAERERRAAKEDAKKKAEAAKLKKKDEEKKKKEDAERKKREALAEERKRKEEEERKREEARQRQRERDLQEAAKKKEAERKKREEDEARKAEKKAAEEAAWRKKLEEEAAADEAMKAKVARDEEAATAKKGKDKDQPQAKAAVAKKAPSTSSSSSSSDSGGDDDEEEAKLLRVLEEEARRVREAIEAKRKAKADSKKQAEAPKAKIKEIAEEAQSSEAVDADGLTRREKRQLRQQRQQDQPPSPDPPAAVPVAAASQLKSKTSEPAKPQPAKTQAAPQQIQSQPVAQQSKGKTASPAAATAPAKQLSPPAPKSGVPLPRSQRSTATVPDVPKPKTLAKAQAPPVAPTKPATPAEPASEAPTASGTKGWAGLFRPGGNDTAAKSPVTSQPPAAPPQPAATATVVVEAPVPEPAGKRGMPLPRSAQSVTKVASPSCPPAASPEPPASKQRKQAQAASVPQPSPPTKASTPAHVAAPAPVASPAAASTAAAADLGSFTVESGTTEPAPRREVAPVSTLWGSATSPAPDAGAFGTAAGSPWAAPGATGGWEPQPAAGSAGSLFGSRQQSTVAVGSPGSPQPLLDLRGSAFGDGPSTAPQPQGAHTLNFNIESLAGAVATGGHDDRAAEIFHGTDLSFL